MRHLLFGLLCLTACSPNAGSITLSAANGMGFSDLGVVVLRDGGSEDDAGIDAGYVEVVLPPFDAGTAPIVCGAGFSGTLFSDVTEKWGIGKQGLKVVGTKMSVADLDGDGYPDIAIQSGAPNIRETVGMGTKQVWQLMNRPNPAGPGRVFVDATGNGLFQVRGGSATQYRSAQLTVFGDVDNDGDLDAFSGTYVDPTRLETDTGDRSEIAINDGTGHFSYAAPSATRPGAADHWPTSGASFTDVDRDGKIDVFVGFWYEEYGASPLGVQAQLYKGAGTGSFNAITIPSGLETAFDGFEEGRNHRPSYGVTACDLNDDGAPELLVGAYGRQWNLLYKNDTHGVFTEIGRDAGYAGDDNYNFTDNENFKCWCSGSPGAPNCVGVGAPKIQCPNPPTSSWGVGSDDQPWRNNGNTFTTWCGDVDGDGRNDLYNAEIRHFWAGSASDSSNLLKNAGTGSDIVFARPGNAATGMDMGRVGSSWNEGGIFAAGGDLDNDGLLDVIVGETDYPDQYALIFTQKPDGKFASVANAWKAKHPCVNGMAVADFDRDGDLDLIVGSGTARDCAAKWTTPEVHLYENIGQDPSRHSLGIKLVGNGTTANRAAIGAKITLRSNGKTQTREVGGGYGTMGMQNDTVVHFGLGGCPAVESVTIRWPDAANTTQTFTNIAADEYIELRMGDPKIYRMRR